MSLTMRCGQNFRYCIHRNFCQEKILPILSPALIGENFITPIFLCYVKDCIEDMAIFTALVKIFSTNFFLQYKGSSAWRNFYPT